MTTTPNDDNAGLTQTTLRGEISRVVFTSEDGSFSVIVITDPQGAEHTITGQISGAFAGQHLEVTGRWETHKDYGRRLRADSWKFTLPSTPEGIRRYLASGLIPGIGPKFAKCIVDHFGKDTLDILDNYSARLQEVPGIGKKRIELIRKSWHDHAARRDIFIFMQSLGITIAYCEKIFRLYGEQAPDIIKASPYRLADEIDGIGFIMADRIAAALGLAKNSPERITAGIVYGMNQIKMAGHTCYPQPDFIKQCVELLEISEADALSGLEHAVSQRKVIVDTTMPDEPMIYDRGLYRAETELPELLRQLLNNPRHHGQAILRIAPTKEQKFSREQLEAVTRAGHSAVSIITGGPGVGKTTVVGEIVRRARAANLKIYLAAPTGRAAQRLSETAGIKARTIHRMLKWEPENKKFAYGRDLKLPCQLLILDEVSMLDLPLAVHLFRAVDPGTTVILVGDADQLPSVGPGDVLNNLIASNLFAVTRLNQVFRQGAGSSIILSAHAVNHGRLPDLTPPADKNELRDFYWIEQDDAEQAVDQITRLVVERIPARFGFEPMRDIQVLSPMNRGSCGTISLNAILQEHLNGGHKPQFTLGDRIFKIGDRVMQTSNNYDKNVFNGDMGRIANIVIQEKKFTVSYDGRPVDYDLTEADQLTLAYAITVHKSQGSEFPAVVLPLLNQHYMMLQRNLLYTAMTRARKLLVLVGSRKAVSMAVSNATREPRFTLLLQRLCALAANKKTSGQER